MTSKSIDTNSSFSPKNCGTQTSITVLRSEAEVEQWRILWERWRGHRDADLDFYMAVLRSRSEVVCPYVLVCSRDGKPQSMLIGRLERAQLSFRIGYLTICRPNVRLLSFIPWGLRGDTPPESSRALVEEILRALRRREAETAVLAFVDANSSICHLGKKLPGILSRDFLSSVNVHWRMSLTGGIDGVYHRLSSDHRGQLRRKAKRLHAEFGDGLKVDCLRGTSDVERVIRDVEEVACKTYQRGLGVGFCISDEVWNRLRLQAQRGWLRAYILYLAGKPCAFWVGSLYEGTFYSDYLAHDPAYDNHSVGNFLTIKTIEALCAEGAQWVDFGPGDSRYKRQFGTTSTDETSIFIFAPGLKGAVLNLARTASGMVDSTLKKALERTNLLPTLKKIWRRRAARPTQPLATAAESH